MAGASLFDDSLSQHAFIPLTVVLKHPLADGFAVHTARETNA
jgi:hypothetical protein